MDETGPDHDKIFTLGAFVGDKLMEVNVFSPGGLGSSQALYEENFSVPIIEDLERKIHVRKHYVGQMGNVNLAAL